MPGQRDPDDLRMTFGDHLEELRARVIRALAGVVVAAVLTLTVGQRLIAILLIPLVQVQRQLRLPDQVYTFSPFEAFGVYIKVSLIAGVILASPWVLYQAWCFIATGLYRHERQAVHILAPFSTIMTVLGLAFSYFIMLPICLTFLLWWSVSYPPVGEGFGFVDRITQISALQQGGGEAATSPRQVGGDDSGTPSAEGLAGAQGGADAAGGDSAGQPQQMVQLPVLERDPASPREGQMWIKSPEQQTRLFVGGRVVVVHRAGGSPMTPLMGVNEYISFALMVTLGIVIGFQLPVVMLVLGWTRLIAPDWLARYRRYALLICFIAGAILTPSDPLSMVVLALPLYLLFELGLLVMRLAYHRSARTSPANTDDSE